MAHKEQKDFCQAVKAQRPGFFYGVNVLDVGSLDINGANKILFDSCRYTGLDLAEGPNVDVVSFVHKFEPNDRFDTVISTEAFEHDYYFPESIDNCIRLTKHGGLFLFTAAGPGRPEHGTKRTSPLDSPFTCLIEGQENYYRNITKEWLSEVVDLSKTFQEYAVSYGRGDHDIYFWGIKR